MVKPPNNRRRFTIRGTGRAAFAATLLLIVLGLIQITGGISLFAGNAYGRVIGLTAAGLGAIAALLSIGGAYPWWSLAIFALCIYIIHGIYTLGQDERGLVS